MDSIDCRLTSEEVSGEFCELSCRNDVSIFIGEGMQPRIYETKLPFHSYETHCCCTSGVTSRGAADAIH